jgi:hypothetical protein
VFKRKEHKSTPERVVRDEDVAFKAATGDRFAGEPIAGSKEDDLHNLLVRVVETIQDGDTAEGVAGLREFLGLIDTTIGDNQRHRLADMEARQGTYLAASGTLTQSNCILAAALAGALATLNLGSLRLAFTAALMLHVRAAAVLFWAARPIAPKREPTPTMAFIRQVALVDHAFRNYQRGWRLTMLAFVATAIAGVLLGLQILGISLPLSLLLGQGREPHGWSAPYKLTLF